MAGNGKTKGETAPTPRFSREAGPRQVGAERKSRILVCIECGEEFVFTVAAQEYFEEMGFQQAPKRCKICHGKYKREQRPH